jgi:hypothetical protein
MITRYYPANNHDLFPYRITTGNAREKKRSFVRWKNINGT